MATDSESQFSSRDSMWLSDSGSAEDVEEYEIRGKMGQLYQMEIWGQSPPWGNCAEVSGEEHVPLHLEIAILE